METKKVKFSELPKFNKFAIIFALVSISFFIIIVAVTPASEKPKEKATVDQAWIVSHEFVKMHLVSPASAEFGSKYQFDQVNDSTWWLGGYVDSQNAFGANLRTNFQVKMMFLGGEWTKTSNWTEVDFRLIDY